VGVTEVEDQIWLVSFLDYDLGYFDNERGRVEPGPNPFAPDKVLTMCPAPCVRIVVASIGVA
jgi:putative transposase